MSIKVVTKTKLMGGFQCKKLLYWQVHRPKWARAVSNSEQLLFDQGHAVGAEARKRFPGGVLIEAPAWEYEQARQATAAAMEAPESIFEAAFLNGPLFVRVDILEKTKTGWNLIEVKSSVSVKEENIRDCAIQYTVLKGMGVAVEKVKLMFINRECKAPHLENLFITEDVTERVRALTNDTKNSIKSFLEILKEPNPPEVRGGPHCGVPYECRFKQTCWQDMLIPQVSVLNLPTLKQEEKWELFHKGETFETLKLDSYSEVVQRATRAHLNGEIFVDSKEIQKELSSWKRPLWFLDFETIGFAVPRFEGTHPYDQIPFQYSLHVQSEGGGGLRHEEFLDTTGGDPREKLIQKLLSDIGPEGDIVAYYANFEKSVIEQLAITFPKYSDALRKLLPRFRDPLPLIRKTVYQKEFMGSFSLKSVGPALVGSEFSYSDLAVRDGSMAQAAYLECLRRPSDEIEVALREYCGRDTHILVKLVEKLTEMSEITS